MSGFLALNADVVMNRSQLQLFYFKLLLQYAAGTRQLLDIGLRTLSRFSILGYPHPEATGSSLHIIEKEKAFIYPKRFKKIDKQR